MAPSFSNAKIISTFVVDRLSVVASRRGYAAASQSASSVSSGVSRGGGNVMMRKGREDSTKTNKTNSWIPDPKTGYYRPENRSGGEIDAAELRRMLLKNKN